jgi:hypothetical protein
MKKSENGPLIGGVGDLVKMMDRGSGTWWKSIIQSTLRGPFSEFFIQMENFPCMSSDPYENGTQRWSYGGGVSREGGAQASFWPSPRPRFIIFTKSPTPPIRGPFSDFFIQMENFPCKSSGPYESGIQRWS